MAPSAFLAPITWVLVSCTLLMVALAAPPQPPSSPAISAAISPHPAPSQPLRDDTPPLYQDLERSHKHAQRGRLVHSPTLGTKSNHHHHQTTLTSNEIDGVYNAAFEEEHSSQPEHDDLSRVLMLNNEIADMDDAAAADEADMGQGTNNDGDNDEQGDEEDDGSDGNLGPALKVLARRKRTPQAVANTKPYSSEKSRARSASRYRYPLYRKRSSRVPPQHDYPQDDQEEPFFNLYEDYPEVDVISGHGRRGPSLFRERTTEPSRGKFLEEPLPSNLLRASARDGPLGEVGAIAGSPYDLEVLSQMLDAGSGKNEVSPSPESLDLLREALESLQQRKMEEEMRKEQLKNDEAELLQELVNRAGGEYYQDNRPEEYAYPRGNSLIRRKRGVRILPVTTEKNIATNNTSLQVHKIKIPEKVAVAEYRARLVKDRKKRAFGSPLQYARRKKAFGQKARTKEEIDDFLTREYFKTIARSVGNKKKRMAFGRFEAEKRSRSIDAFLDNPEMLQYMMDKLKVAEDSVAEEAESDMLSDASRGVASEAPFLLRNAIARLDAMERMRDALAQLKELTEHAGGGEVNAARRKKAGGGLEPLRQPASYRPHHPECPALERIVTNCGEVSELTGDAGQAFLPACVRHEVCYMCGSGLGVSGHECDALLSSALEASCGGALDCLSAAGETFNLLSDARRYDHSGTCARQPCIKSLLESR